MRKAMSCVSFMLAIVQLWPLAFAHRSMAEVASPAAHAAVVIPVPKRMAAVALVPVSASIPASVSKSTAPSSCFQEYRAKGTVCVEGEAGCGAKAADQWDLCEATGFWPD